MEPAESVGRKAGSLALTLASFVIIVAGLRAAASILQPILLALFLAVLSLPLLQWLRRHGVRTSLAVAATVLADLALLSVLGLLLSGAVNEFARAAPTFLEQLFTKSRSGLTYLEGRGLEVSKWVTLEPIAPRQMMDVVGGILQGTVRGVASAISFVTMVAVALIFLLFELLVLPEKLRSALPQGQDATRHFSSFTREIQRYLAIKTVISIFTGLVVGFWVWLMGVDFALFWGVAAFLLNYIPVLGPLIAGVPAVLFALVQLGWAQALILGVGYLVIKLIIGDLIEPALMGRRFGLSTFMVLVALVFWGWVWGPLGMILSVPLTMMIKIALSHTERYRWVAVLLGPGAVTEAVRSPAG